MLEASLNSCYRIRFGLPLPGIPSFDTVDTPTMSSTCSPRGDAGGSVHLLSPTHIHQVDPTSTFKIRRSLSRSPSKISAFRLVTSKSTSPSPSPSLSPSYLSPPNRSTSTPLLAHVAQIAPVPPSIQQYPTITSKLRTTNRTSSPIRTSSRAGSRQRSPGKRTLSESGDQGNSQPQSSAGSSSDDIENRVAKNISSAEPLANSAPTHDWFSAEEKSFAPLRTVVRTVGLGGPPAKSSPLKRSDGIMNLDQASMGSPSAKRRSLHSASFGTDFDIFDHEATLRGEKDDRDCGGHSSADSTTSIEPSSSFSSLPKRTSSLRRSTLQQRHEKPTLSRSKLNSDLAYDAVTPGPANVKSKFRQSLGNILPSKNRESPFTFQGSLPSASAHPMSQYNSQSSAQGDQPRTQRHPLSRTLTQSSSNSSIAEDSPTHIPVRQPGPRRPLIDFSKSLPMVGQRPPTRETSSVIADSQASSNGLSLATPENYKLARPNPAAFASTGLISKRHVNIDEVQPGLHVGKSLMPDTPCKRHSLMGAPTPAVAPSSKPDFKDRHIRHSFGTPSTPYSSHATRAEPGTFGKGVSIFGSNVLKSNLQRRGSFLSIEGEENSQSPLGKGESQSSAEVDLPPTPTKQALASNSFQQAHVPQSSLGGFPSAGAAGPDVGSALPDQACKSFPIGSPSRSADEDSDNMMDESPSVALRFRNSLSMPASFSRSRRISAKFKSPTPLNQASFTLPSLSYSRLATKRSPLSPASPINNLFERLSPHTPRDHVITPDPSRLSISAHGDGISRPMEGITSSASLVPPATPTMMRDSFPNFGASISSTTPLHSFQPLEIDQSLLRRFDKVEIVGSGEFSQVYRCSKAQEAKEYFALSINRSSPKTPLPDRVWAVKKSRKPFLGSRDRQRKLQEVNILKSLSISEHVLQFVDSWEEKNHLYIQTEFCEEGTLDVFLVQEGRKGRLDDFRIWKIMAELTLVRLHSPQKHLAG